MMITDFDVPKVSSSYTAYTIDKNYNKFFNIQDLLDVDNSMNSFYSGNNSLYYLAPTAYEDYYHRGKAVYPQYSMTPDFKNINKNTLTAKDERYKFSIHNYLSEIVNTFIDNSSLSTFISVPDGDFGTFLSGTTYSMGISIEKQNKDLKMFVKYNGSGEFTTRVNLTPASLYGPPSRFFESSSLQVYSVQNYLADISFAPFLPPYYFGSSEIKLSFTPTETREFSAKEIIENLVIRDQPTQDIINAFTTIFPSNSNYQNSIAYQSMQNLKKCLNISLTKEREKTLNSEVGETTSNVSEDRISIQTLFESPILNFNNQSNLSASEYFTGTSVQRIGANFIGMWSGYGQIPADDEAVTISLLDKYESGSLSLLNKCFSKTILKKSIGKLRDTTELSEAIVLIPYTHIDTNEYATVSRVDLENGIDQTNEQSEYVVPYYYNLDINVINKLLNIDDKQARLFLNRKNVDLEYLRKLDERLQTLNKNNSIVSCMSNMQKYVLPPHLDWIRNTQVNPFAMYFIEFSQKLTKQDLADIWQGLLPSSGTSFKVVNSSIEHELGDLEFYHGKKLQPDLRFKIFKVKKRAKTNYYELTSDLEDDRKYKGRFGTQQEVVPLYSYNWPHDHYSLIQGSKVTVELQLSKEQE
jgi:hypothetical protein